MHARIDNNFEYHTPTQEKIESHYIVRRSIGDLAHMLVNMLPESRELSLALTKLEEAMFWANAAIARNK